MTLKSQNHLRELKEFSLFLTIQKKETNHLFM